MDDLTLKFNKYRRLIEHEDNLVNHRVSWLLIAQSFLLGACVSRNDYPYFIIILGIFSTSIAYISIIAAILELNKIKNEIENEKKRNKAFRNLRPDIISKGNIWFLGDLGGYLLPIAFLITWFWLLIIK